MKAGCGRLSAARRRLFSGALAVKDLPTAWNTLSQELLGLTPTADKQGV